MDTIARLQNLSSSYRESWRSLKRVKRKAARDAWWAKFLGLIFILAFGLLISGRDRRSSETTDGGSGPAASASGVPTMVGLEDLREEHAALMRRVGSMESQAADVERAFDDARNSLEAASGPEAIDARQRLDHLSQEVRQVGGLAEALSVSVREFGRLIDSEQLARSESEISPLPTIEGSSATSGATWLPAGDDDEWLAAVIAFAFFFASAAVGSAAWYHRNLGGQLDTDIRRLRDEKRLVRRVLSLEENASADALQLERLENARLASDLRHADAVAELSDAMSDLDRVRKELGDSEHELQNADRFVAMLDRQIEINAHQTNRLETLSRENEVLSDQAAFFRRRNDDWQSLLNSVFKKIGDPGQTMRRLKIQIVDDIYRLSVLLQPA